MFIVFNASTISSGGALVAGYSGARGVWVGNSGGGTGSAGVVNTYVAWMAITSAGSVSINNTTLTTTRINSGISYIALNGSTSFNTGGTGFSSGTTTYLGREAGSGYGYVGYAMEIIIYNTDLSLSDRQKVEAYLAQKWNIDGVLPSGHTGLLTKLTRSLDFTPLSIPGCQVWLDAADSSTQTFSGSGLTAWLDKSSNAYNFNQLAGAPSGFTATNAIIGTSINGLRTLYFDPGASIKQSTTLDGVTNMFWVGRISSIGSGRNYFLFGHDSYYDWHSDYYPGKFCETTYCQTGIKNASPSALYTSDVAATTNAAFSAISFPTAPNISILSVSGITGSTRYQGICYDRNGGHIGWCGDVAEVITFNSALTTFQIQQIESYLAQKWGLTSTLPAGHPGLTKVLYGTSIQPIQVTPYTSVSYAFAPTQITGCQLWLDGADPAGNLTIPANGSSVSTWTDKSGYANSPTSSSGTYPTYNSSLKCVSWAGGATQLTFPTTIANAVVGKAFTVFFVQQRTAGGADNFIIRGTAGATNQNLLIGYVNPATYYRFAFYGNDLDAASGSYVSGESASVTCFMYSKPNRGIYINGSISANSSDTNSSDLTAWAGAMIGGNSGWAAYYGNVYEMIIYASSLSLTNRQLVEGYLAQKWGLKSSLAASHPGLITNYYLNQFMTTRGAITTIAPAISTPK
jgi:hypothetical protein